MKKKVTVTAIIAGIFLLSLISFPVLHNQRKIRVACVGDSITHGAYLTNRKSEAYPAQLQKLLGNGYLIKNYGVNSATLQNNGDKPYTEEKFYQKSLDFQPDIVLIMLGTNDTKSQNRGDLPNFRRDYESLIESYSNLSSHPTIYLLTPPPIYSVNKKNTLAYSMHRDSLDEEITVIKNLAKKYGLTLIDIHTELTDHPKYFTRDGVHPDKDGAFHIANFIYNSLIGESSKESNS